MSYRVEKVINKRVKHDSIEYLIKWYGYPKNQSTWEPYSNLKAIQFLIDEYEKDNCSVSSEHKTVKKHAEFIKLKEMRRRKKEYSIKPSDGDKLLFNYQSKKPKFSKNKY